MYSRLDAIFKTMPRDIEPADTRQYIGRHEDDPPHKEKDQNSKKHDDSALWEDHTTLSVAVLRAFLTQLLPGADPAENKMKGPDPASDTGTQQPDKDQKSAADPSEKAARAYEKTYRATHKTTEAAPSIDNNQYSTAPQATLSDHEQQLIHKMLRDLKILEDAGKAEINIPRSDDFAGTLAQTIASEKLKLS